MKANELRVGNLVVLKSTQDEDEIAKLLSIDEIEGCYYNNAEDSLLIDKEYGKTGNSFCIFEIINPILLTEDWLSKFGFKNLTDKENIKSLDLFINKGVIGFYANNEDNYNSVYVYSGIYEDRDQIRICKNIKYVHQLQNLYFTLTGNELLLTQ